MIDLAILLRLERQTIRRTRRVFSTSPQNFSIRQSHNTASTGRGARCIKHRNKNYTRKEEHSRSTASRVIDSGPGTPEDAFRRT